MATDEDEDEDDDDDDDDDDVYGIPVSGSVSVFVSRSIKK